MGLVTKIQESHVERTDDDHTYLMYESEWYEPFTSDRGKLFRSLQKEYGRCVSKVYHGEGTPIGWVFEKRERYEGTARYGRPAQYFIREVWITVAPDAWARGL